MKSKVSYHWVSEKEYEKVVQKPRAEVFHHIMEFPVSRVYSASESKKIKQLTQKIRSRVKLFLLVKEGSRLVGWTSGYQQDRDIFYMDNSAVLHNYREQGVYSAMLIAVIEKCRDLGFQLIRSRHYPTNNAVLIAKLKRGFVISGFEIDDEYGAQVHLTYYFNSNRRAVVDFRSGYKDLDKSLKKKMT